MPYRTIRAAAPLAIFLASSAAVTESHAAQPPAAQRSTPAAAAQPARETVVIDVDAQSTRRALVEVLRKHPPSVARVLKLDPSLMRNESYLAAYPSLAQFLAQHPEIPQNAPYYLDDVYISDGDWTPPNQRVRLLEGVLAGLAGFTAFFIGLGALFWLVKTVLEQRRWSRLSKIQAEVHSKLMDRFSNNDELMAYVQTRSGQRFLESGPSPVEPGPAPVGAPFTRILWSVQIGVILLVAGAGLLYVSAETLEELREFFFICGSLAIAIGAGFTVSAVASYALSWKLGLLDRRTTEHA